MLNKRDAESKTRNVIFWKKRFSADELTEWIRAWEVDARESFPRTEE